MSEKEPQKQEKNSFTLRFSDGELFKTDTQPVMGQKIVVDDESYDVVARDSAGVYCIMGEKVKYK